MMSSRVPRSNSRPKKSSVIRIFGMLVIAVFCLSGIANAARVERDGRDLDCQKGRNACALTSEDMLKSCIFAAHSVYWLDLAKAENITDPSEKKAAKMQAAEDLKTGLEDCQAQFEVRKQVCKALGGGPYDPIINPSDFTTAIDNPYFSLVPGTTFIYEGTQEGGTTHIEVQVTSQTRTIIGVTCVVVRDTGKLNGQLIEDTLDYYAQDKSGNVWYFGEDAKQFQNGVIVGLEGSWLAGVDGAKPGIVMLADPKVGFTYRQEFALGTAEDVAQVLALNATATVPYGTFTNCLETKDFSALEPTAIENKFFAKGVGQVLTIDTVTGDREELVSITH